MLPSFLKLHHQERNDDDLSWNDHAYNHNDDNHDNQVSNIGLGSLKAFSSDDCELNEELVTIKWKTSSLYKIENIYKVFVQVIQHPRRHYHHHTKCIFFDRLALPLTVGSISSTSASHIAARGLRSNHSNYYHCHQFSSIVSSLITQQVELGRIIKKKGWNRRQYAVCTKVYWDK